MKTLICLTCFACSISAYGQALTHGDPALLGAVQAAAGSTFSPADYTPYAWYQADAGVTNYSDVLASNGDRVKVWKDQSGNNRHLYGPATSTDSVRYNTGIQNSKPGVKNVDTDKITSAAVSVSQPLTVYCVYHVDALYNAYFMSDSTNDTSRVALYMTPANVPSAYCGSSLLDEDALSDDTTYIFTYVINGNSSAIWKNGTEVKTGPVGSENMDGLTLCASPAFAYESSGYVCEWIVYSGAAHNSTQIGNVVDWLNSASRWDVY